MPYADNQGIKLHYQVFQHQSNRSAEPVLLLHGFSGNLEQWQMAGFVQVLHKDYKVIAVDLRGHGKSSKPHAADAYTLVRRLSDITALLDHLQLSRVHIIAYSMGGWLAFAMTKAFPQRILSLCIGGAHPFQDAMSSFHQAHPIDTKKFVLAFEHFIGEPLSDMAQTMVLNNDLQALIAAAQDREDMSEVIERLKTIPTMLFIGEQDQRAAAMALYSGPPLISAVQSFLEQNAQQNIG